MEDEVWCAVTKDVEYRDLKASGGPPAVVGDLVELLYSAYLFDRAALDGKGDLIETTADPPNHFSVLLDDEHLLPGIVQGVDGMQAGGSLRQIRVRSEAAFGDRGYRGVVPPAATLVFDVILSTVEKQ